MQRAVDVLRKLCMNELRLRALNTRTTVSPSATLRLRQAPACFPSQNAFLHSPLDGVPLLLKKKMSCFWGSQSIKQRSHGSWPRRERKAIVSVAPLLWSVPTAPVMNTNLALFQRAAWLFEHNVAVSPGKEEDDDLSSQPGNQVASDTSPSLWLLWLQDLYSLPARAEDRRIFDLAAGETRAYARITSFVLTVMGFDYWLQTTMHV